MDRSPDQNSFEQVPAQTWHQYQDPHTGWWHPDAYKSWWDSSWSWEGWHEYSDWAWQNWAPKESDPKPQPQAQTQSKPNWVEQESKRRKIFDSSDFPALAKPKSQARGSRFAAKILQSEWDGEVRLTTISQIQKALEKGEPFPGNLICTRDPAALEEAKNVPAAFEVEEALTVAEVAAKESLGPCLGVWWQHPGKTRAKPQRVKVKTHQIGATPGPTPKVPRSVLIRHKPAVEMCTLRLLAPAFYRQVFFSAGVQDTPSSVIAAWAKTLEIPVSQLTGGRWEKTTCSRGLNLIGHLRVPFEIGQKAVASSGKRALFATVLTKSKVREPVAWVRRRPGTSDEEYLRVALAQAEAQICPLVIRQSGPSDLGIAGGTCDEEARPKHFVLRNAPLSWDESDVEDFFHSVEWQQVRVLTRRSAWTPGHLPEWIIKGVAPISFKGGSVSFTDQDVCLSVSLEAPRKHKKVVSEKVSG